MKIMMQSKRWGGSSPRTWGTLKKGMRNTVINRFIPTDVGNTKLPWIRLNK